MKRIPISAAAHIAETYGYDQVIIIARKVGDDPAPHGEHCTTYGVDMANCRAAALIGDFLKYKVMGWPTERYQPGDGIDWDWPKNERGEDDEVV
jgi:hypothetical protein